MVGAGGGALECGAAPLGSVNGSVAGRVQGVSNRLDKPKLRKGEGERKGRRETLCGVERA